MAEYLLPAWLAALHRKVPDAILAVEVTNSAQVVVRVREHHADVGFVEGHQPRLEAMKTVVVRTDHLVMVVDPSHPWADPRSPVTGAELAAAKLIVRESGSGTRQVLEDTLAAFGGLRTTWSWARQRRSWLPLAAAKDLRCSAPWPSPTTSIPAAWSLCPPKGSG